MPIGRPSVQFWTAEEDAVIEDGVAESRRLHGNAQIRWSEITQRLPNRNVHDIRLRRRRILDARLRLRCAACLGSSTTRPLAMMRRAGARRNGVKPRQVCHKCGAFPKRGHSCPFANVPQPASHASSRGVYGERLALQSSNEAEANDALRLHTDVRWSPSTNSDIEIEFGNGLEPAAVV